jgi:hypothetical protein
MAGVWLARTAGAMLLVGAAITLWGIVRHSI